MKISPPLTVAMTAAILVSAAAAGAAESAPFQQVLPVMPVALELSDCRIDVDIQRDVEPLLRVIIDPTAAGEAPEFEVSQNGGRIHIARSGDDGAGPATTTVELVLDPTQALDIRGAGLTISVHGEVTPELPSRPAAANDGDSPEPQVVTVVQSYDLVDSQVSIVGTPAASIVATNTVVLAEGGAGDLTVELDRGSLTLRRHEGTLRLTASDSQCSVEDLEGAVELQLQGGDLDVSDGKGTVQGQIRSGYLSIGQWTGAARVAGEEATIALRDSAIDQLQLEGTSTTVTIDGLRGSVIARLTGGSLAAEASRGRLEVTALTDAHVEIDQHEGPVVLTMNDDSPADLRNIDGPVTASVEWSELTIDDADALELTARSARITIAGVRRVGKLDARDSELELDLRAVESNSFDLRVADGSSATVDLPSPCRVQLRDSVAASQQIDVTGCEFQMQNMGRWRGSQLRALDGRPAFLLTAKVAESGSLQVRGGP